MQLPKANSISNTSKIKPATATIIDSISSAAKNSSTSTNIYYNIKKVPSSSTTRSSLSAPSSTSFSSSLSNFLLQFRSRTNLTIIVKAQISFLLSRISVENYAYSVTELNTLSRYNGQDTYFYLLRQLVIVINTLPRKNNNIEILKHLLTEKIEEISIDPLLLNIFREVLNSIDNKSLFKDFNLDSLLDLGSKCCSTVNSFNEVLAKLGVHSSASGEIIKEVDVARALGVMALTTANLEDDSSNIAWNQSNDLFDNNNSNWNVEIFVSSLSELQPHLDWVKVIKQLDYPEFTIKDTKGVQLILTAFRKAAKDQQKFPIHLFWGSWSNLKGQFSFLHQLIQLSPDAFNINDYPVQKVLTIDDFPNSPTNSKSLSEMLTSCPWNSLELIETLIKMADTDLFEDVRVTFELSIKQAPELICLGLVQIQRPWNSLHIEFVNRLLSTFLTGHLNSTLVLSRIWNIDNNIFIETALASRREYLNLEKWLQEKINEHGEAFVHDCMEFLKQKITLEVTHETNGNDQAVRLADEVVLKFLRVISNSNMTPENEEYFKEIRKTLAQIYPSLSIIPLDGSIPPPLEQSFPAEIEEIANLYFEKVYRQEIEIEEKDCC
ncbi:16678_t:CDS:2 [Entrophospora sp. SA101]|nr:16678_t:CDS:2 [Entrophospora sp. SA101]